MRILGIETSCDETSASVVEDGVKVLSLVIASSRGQFERSGGVIPEQAARRQVECIMPVIEQALEEAKVEPTSLDAIAVTKGPGLLGSLLVGTIAARTCASVWNVPIIGVHHTLGHLSSTWLGAEEDIRFPVLTISASGGHTELWHRTSHLSGQLLGRTRDDAAGEAFDKGASLLGLPYPGGPEVSKCGKNGNPHAHEFPLPLKQDPTFDFSFAGLKTSLRYLLRDLPSAPSASELSDIAASYEYALCAHLLNKLSHALNKYPDTQEVHFVGGVSANTRLRELAAITAEGRTLRFPKTLAYCTDNAAMIAAAGQFLLEAGMPANEAFETVASLPLEEALKQK